MLCVLKTYKEDVLEETEFNWIECVCKKWVHEDCISEIVMDFVHSMYHKLYRVASYIIMITFLHSACIIKFKDIQLYNTTSIMSLFCMNDGECLLINGNFSKNFLVMQHQGT